LINIDDQDWLEFKRALLAAIEVERDDLESCKNVEYTRGRVSMCRDLLLLRDETELIEEELI